MSERSSHRADLCCHHRSWTDRHRLSAWRVSVRRYVDSNVSRHSVWNWESQWYCRSLSVVRDTLAVGYRIAFVTFGWWLRLRTQSGAVHQPSMGCHWRAHEEYHALIHSVRSSYSFPGVLLRTDYPCRRRWMTNYRSTLPTWRMSFAHRYSCSCTVHW